jgi:7,8-dihydropterin-6-yl-methyl-4-(beta-D-ribofuranosyl)aminobenzene 5'-phosphate synthase
VSSPLRQLVAFPAALLLSTTLLAAPTGRPLAAQAPTPPAARTVSSLDITILSTMLADRGFGEWGFAALVEVDGRRILFDTGAYEDTVQRNVKALGLDLRDVESVVLSHNHWDHTTGLMPLRRELRGASAKALGTVYAGRGLFFPRVANDGRLDDRMARIRTEYEAIGGTVVEVEGPHELMPGVWLTGPVPRVHPERNWSMVGKVRTDRGEVEDTVPEDMALVVRTAKGLVYLFGCGHAGVINTLEHGRKAIDPAPVEAIIGGLHLFQRQESELAWTAQQIKTFGVRHLVGAHCTGLEAVYRIRELAGLTRQTCIVGAVGASYSLAKGINPLMIAR